MDTTSAILIAGPVIGLGLGIILGRIASRPDYWRRKFITAQAKVRNFEAEEAKRQAQRVAAGRSSGAKRHLRALAKRQGVAS